jgi:hypothetical protein
MDRSVPEASATTMAVATRMDVNDFHRRWQAARVAALKQVAGMAADQPAATEGALLQQILPAQRDAVLKAVYTNTRKLGQSALGYFALLWDTDDVREVLSQADVPCLQGQWSSDGPNMVVERRGCSMPQQCGTLGCDYWQEAIDGLLMGLGDAIRHTRHRSAGHGDECCRDVFNSAPRAQENAAYGPLPEYLGPFLSNLKQQFVPAHVQVTFVGYAAGVVYYQATAPDMGCGQPLWPTILQRAVAKTYPTLRLQNVSPAAVLG